MDIENISGGFKHDQNIMSLILGGVLLITDIWKLVLTLSASIQLLKCHSSTGLKLIAE
jgi:hypothetical protein